MVGHFMVVLIFIWGVNFDKEQDICKVLECLNTGCLLGARKK